MQRSAGFPMQRSAGFPTKLQGSFVTKLKFFLSKLYLFSGGRIYPAGFTFPSLDQLHIFDDSIVFSLTSIFWFYDAVFFSLYDISRKIIWYVNCRGISPFITQMALVSDRDNNFHRSIIFSMYIVQARCSFCGKIQCTSLLLFVLLLLLRCS